MTVYTHDPFGGMRNPAPYGGGIAGGLMNRPPPFMPQQPMPQMPMDETIYTPRMPQGPRGSSEYRRMPQFPTPQMPRRMPGGPSKGGTTSIPMPRPPMQRPGGPGKGRTRGGLMRRGRGRPMPGGPGKGRGRMQQPMPQINFGQGSMPMPTPRTQGPTSMPQSPFMRTHALPALPLNRGFYGGGITDLY